LQDKLAYREFKGNVITHNSEIGNYSYFEIVQPLLLISNLNPDNPEKVLVVFIIVLIILEEKYSRNTGST